MTNWMCWFSAAHYSEQTQRKATLPWESPTSRSQARGSTGDIFQINELKLRILQKVTRFVSMYLLWKKAAKTVSKLLNIVLKCVWDTPR